LTETRATFAQMGTAERAVWYSLAVVSTAIFLWGSYRLWRKYASGRDSARPEQLLRGTLRALRVVVTHAWIMRRATTSGIAHLCVFYGFLVLLLGTTILGIQDDIARPLFGFDFWRGDFYLGYSLFLDLFGLALLVGLIVFAVRRGLERLPRLDYTRVDGRARDRSYRVGDWVFLGALIYLGASGFLLEGLRVAETSPSFERWAPAGWLLGQALRGAGLGTAAAQSAHHVLWWAHGVVALSFVSAIPFTKALHMVTGPTSISTRNQAAGKQLALDPAGYTVISDLTPQHLLQLDACTKCGKCHEACPATQTGMPLSPRDVILDLAGHARESFGPHFPSRDPTPSCEGDVLVGGTIRQETLWSCMQCMACVEICPVGIEHVPIINELRRSAVNRGELDTRLQTTLETIYTSGNSFGEARRKRSRWAKDLDFPVKDIRKEPAEILWFVGDYASFDPRNKRATLAFAQLLHHAGVDFGILHDAEVNAGCDVRRAGEEGLYTELVAKNMEAISACTFDRIVSTDPHSFHTLRNEYAQFGGNWDVSHHSQLLLELLHDGAIVPRHPVDARVTYHDPCKLGRYNGVYEAPREVIAAVGAELVDMPRSRDNSFCCGAGGGRIWMSETGAAKAPRPSELRITEALTLGSLDYFVVACPKDVTMYEDAIKTTGHAADIELRELSELVLESLSDPATNAAVGTIAGAAG
jgi:Fe-S oxidoreductase